MAETVNQMTYNVQNPRSRVAPKTVYINKLKAYHSCDTRVNMICCAEEDSQTGPLIDLITPTREHGHEGRVKPNCNGRDFGCTAKTLRGIFLQARPDSL